MNVLPVFIVVILVMQTYQIPEINMKKIIAVLFFLLSVSDLFAVQLKWDIPKGNRLEIVRTASVIKLINSRVNSRYDERNIIDLTCVSREKGGSRVEGVFSVYERGYGEDIFLQKAQYETSFFVESSGKFHVPAKFYMPNLRNIPSFPDGRDLKEGDKWTATGELVLNNFSRPFKLMFPVNYTLVSVKQNGNKSTAVISYNFIIDKRIAGRGIPRDFPAKIYGQNVGNIYWNISENSPVGIKDSYRILFGFLTGNYRVDTVEFKMNIESVPRMYGSLQEDEREKAKEEMKKALPENSGIDVDLDKRGLVLRLGEILFDFDSHTLKNEARSNLNSAIDVIKKKYPDRELIIEGHTDNIGRKEYNKSLSEKRARTVAEYLKQKAGHDKLSYRGYGDEKPIEDNSTKEGRKKNRRVEVIIKLK